MRRVDLSVFVVCCAVGLACLVGPNSALAWPPFKKEFEKKYLKAAPSTNEEKMFAESAKTAKCNMCHKGKEKKERNAYGMALAKFLTKKDRKDVAKINKALDDVDKMHSVATDPKSPTFGDLIKQGKLPAGEPVADH